MERVGDADGAGTVMLEMSALRMVGADGDSSPLQAAAGPPRASPAQ